MEYVPIAKKALLDPRAAQCALYGALLFAPFFVFILRPLLAFIASVCAGHRCQMSWPRLRMPRVHLPCVRMPVCKWPCLSNMHWCGSCGCVRAVVPSIGRCLAFPFRLVWALFYRVFLLIAGLALYVCHAVIRAAKAVRNTVRRSRAALDERKKRALKARVAWSRADAAKVAKKYGDLYSDDAETASGSSEEEEEEEEEPVPAPRRSSGARASASPARVDDLYSPDELLPRLSRTTHHEEVPLAEELEEVLEDDAEEEARQDSRLVPDLEVRGSKVVLHPTRLRRRDAPVRWMRSVKSSYQTRAGSMSHEVFSRSRTPVLSIESHVRGLFTQFRRRQMYESRNITESSLEQLYGRPAFQKWYSDSRDDLLQEVRLRRHFVIWRSVLVFAFVAISMLALPAFSFTNKAHVTFFTTTPAGVDASAATLSQLVITRMAYLRSATAEARVPAFCVSRLPAALTALVGAIALMAEMLVLVAAVLAFFTAAFMPRRASSTATAALIAFVVIVAEAAQATSTGRVRLGMGFLVGFGVVAAGIAKAMN